jgi:short subunit fatty acids transporter
LEGELLASQNNIKEQQASVEGIVYDSKHISVIGIPFGKGAFLILTAIIVGGLVVMLVIIMGRMKIAHGAMKEKELIAHTLTQEFDEYKKKALEKQSKLSRELQNERNRLVDMRGQKM